MAVVIARRSRALLNSNSGNLATLTGRNHFRRIDEIRCFEGGLRAIANTEPAQKRGHVDFGRCLGDIQRPGDLFVRKTPG